jgi:outer membrane protein TolC
MKNRKKICRLFAILGLCFVFADGVKAQHRLSLQEAINLSIKNSKQLSVSQARIEEAVAATKQALEARLPGATASGSYLFLSNPTVNFKLKTGSNDSSGSSANQTKVNQIMYAMINASLPIYAGGRIRYGIEASRFLEKAARLDAENDREGIIQNTIEAYNNLYKSQAAIVLVDSNLYEARQRVRDYTSLMQNGVLARNDLLKAQLQESNTELALLDAQNNWRLATVNMNIMLGLPDSTQLFIDNTDFKAINETRSISEFLQLAFISRKDVQALDYRRRAAESGVSAARAESMPTIAVTGGYTALNIPNALTVWNAMNIGVGVQYNIANLWKRGNVDAAKARVKEAEAGRDQLTDAVHLQVVQAYNNYLASQKKIDVYATAVAQAEENYTVITNKFKNGLATVTDVLDADVARLQARLNQAFAISDTYTTYNKLLQTAGLLNNSIETK